MVKKELNFLWSGKDFKTKDYYLPTDPHIIRMTYGEAKLLGKYCQKAKKGILEIGRFFGGSTYFIVNSSPKDIPVLSVDKKNHIKIYSSPKEVPHRRLKSTYASKDYNKVVNYLNNVQKSKKLTLLNIDSKNLKLKDPYDVVFIDGDHSYKGVKNDVEKVLTTCPTTEYIILHDYFEPEGGKFKTYGVKKYVDEIVNKGICEIVDLTHIMVVLKINR